MITIEEKDLTRSEAIDEQKSTDVTDTPNSNSSNADSELDEKVNNDEKPSEDTTDKSQLDPDPIPVINIALSDEKSSIPTEPVPISSPAKVKSNAKTQSKQKATKGKPISKPAVVKTKKSSTNKSSTSSGKTKSTALNTKPKPPTTKQTSSVKPKITNPKPVISTGDNAVPNPSNVSSFKIPALISVNPINLPPRVFVNVPVSTDSDDMTTPSPETGVVVPKIDIIDAAPKPTIASTVNPASLSASTSKTKSTLIAAPIVTSEIATQKKAQPAPKSKSTVSHTPVKPATTKSVAVSKEKTTTKSQQPKAKLTKESSVKPTKPISEPPSTSEEKTDKPIDVDAKSIEATVPADVISNQIDSPVVEVEAAVELDTTHVEYDSDESYDSHYEPEEVVEAEPFSDEQLQYYKQLLLKKRDEFNQQVNGLRKKIMKALDQDNVYERNTGDPDSDFITESSEFAKDEILISRMEENLHSIEDALAAIDDRSYGICQRTGRKIEEERLHVIPWARYCKAAQDDFDSNG